MKHYLAYHGPHALAPKRVKLSNSQQQYSAQRGRDYQRTNVERKQSYVFMSGDGWETEIRSAMAKFAASQTSQHWFVSSTSVPPMVEVFREERLPRDRCVMLQT